MKTFFLVLCYFCKYPTRFIKLFIYEVNILVLRKIAYKVVIIIINLITTMLCDSLEVQVCVKKSAPIKSTNFDPRIDANNKRYFALTLINKCLMQKLFNIFRSDFRTLFLHTWENLNLKLQEHWTISCRSVQRSKNTLFFITYFDFVALM